MFHLKHLAVTSLACVLASQAQAVTTLYAQNFNTPATTVCATWGGAGGGTAGSTLSTDYNGAGQVGTAVFQQVGTADRVCWGRGTPQIMDPSGTGGAYSGGFARNGATTESWAISFDPQGNPFINGSMDLAHITPGNLDGVIMSTNYPGTAASVALGLRYFRLPAGQTFTLADAGGGIPGNVMVGGSPLTPLPESGTVAITKGGAVNRHTADWNAYTFSVDTSTFAAGDKLVIVGTVLNNLTYIVFDNILITAASAASAEPGISKQFGAAQVALGGSTTLTIDVTGNRLQALNGLAVADALPAPLVLGDTVSNTCGGTLTATAGSTQLSLVNGVLPADGCQIQVGVTWPLAATATCTGLAITNTIVDGQDFTVSNTATAGVNATAQLACTPGPTQPPQPPQPPQPAEAAPQPVPGLGAWGLGIAAAAVGGLAWTRRRRPAQRAH